MRARRSGVSASSLTFAMKSAQRFPLLVYQRELGPIRRQGLLIGLTCAVLAGVVSVGWVPGPADLLMVALIALGLAAVLGFLLFLYAWVGARSAYVQCLPSHLRLNTPLYRLALSYTRIYTLRPVKAGTLLTQARQRKLLAPYLGQTCVAVDLKSLPLPRQWLRWLIHPALFPNDSLTLMLLVDDWMTLSNEIEGARAEWRNRQAQKHKESA